MAQITKLEDFKFENELASMKNDDGDFYRLQGDISLEDISYLNSLYRKSVIILENTQGISSELLSKISNDNLFFSVVGGIDYFNKKKYQENDYYVRTLVSKDGLVEIIKYFESIEKYINPAWNDLEKAMFTYSCICEDFTYDEKYDNYLQNGVMERSLNGILLKKLVCAGFAQVYKEAMDRLGIECEYQSKRQSHAFNVLKIDDKYYGSDLTWDCSEKTKITNQDYDLQYFGEQDSKNFYSNRWHNISNDPEETVFELSTLSKEEKSQCLSNIKNTGEKRKNEQLKEKIKSHIKYYPLDSKRQSFAEEACMLSELHKILLVLRINERLDEQTFKELSENVFRFYNIAGDLMHDKKFGMKYSRSELLGSEIGLSDEYSFGLTKPIVQTPNGIKSEHQTDRSLSENTLSEENLQNTLIMLEEKFYSLRIEHLMNIFRNQENIVSRLERLNEIEDKDVNLSIEQRILEEKIDFLIKNKKEILSKGVEETKIDSIIEKFSRYMDVAHPREDYSTHHHDTSLEVLELWMRDFSEIKKMCERHDRRTYTLDEWRSLYLNLPYLKSILDFSEFDGITDEEIQDILNKNIILYDEEVKRYYERINQQNSKLELNTTDANNSFIENGSSDNEWQTLSEIKWPDITEDEIGDHYFR